jgi:hypothetical protein
VAEGELFDEHPPFATVADAQPPDSEAGCQVLRQAVPLIQKGPPARVLVVVSLMG